MAGLFLGVAIWKSPSISNSEYNLLHPTAHNRHHERSEVICYKLIRKFSDMKTFQLDINEKYFQELKWLLSQLPKDSVKLFAGNGYQITIDDDEFELTEDMEAAINEGIDQLERGEGIPHEQVMEEMQSKYPNLKFKKWENGCGDLQSPWITDSEYNSLHPMPHNRHH